MGVDANAQNKKLLKYVQYTIDRTENNIVKLIEESEQQKEIKESINAKAFAKKLYVVIQGTIFMTYTMHNESYLVKAMGLVDEMIGIELKN